MMRRFLEFLGTLLGGTLALAGVVLLCLFARFHTMLLIAGVVGLLAGIAIFSLFRGGRTWPARVGLVLLAGLTLAACQTAPQWMPYLRAADGPVPGESPEPATGGATKKAADNHPFEESAKKLTLEQFLSQHLEPAVKAISAKKGYACTFHKREWCKGLIGDYRLTDETLSMKIRHEPFSVYLHFEQPKMGTEAMYVADKNNGNVIAHSTVFPGSLLGTIRVPPTDAKIMADNRYPITNIGMQNLLKTIRKKAQEHMGKSAGFAISIVEPRKVDDRPCKVIELYNPKPNEEFPMASGRLYLDKEWNVPVGFESYELLGGKVQLVEYYRYTKVKFDPGLKDIDFDPANPDYGYSR